MASREMADCGNSTHPDSTRPRGAFPVPAGPATSASQPGAGPGSGHSDFQKGTTSFWVKGWFPGEMKTLFVVAFSLCVQKFGGFCVCFSLCFFVWELGGFQGSSSGWHTGCSGPVPGSVLATERAQSKEAEIRGPRDLSPTPLTETRFNRCRQLKSRSWEARICG